jgi:micrococcal nuclease
MEYLYFNFPQSMKQYVVILNRVVDGDTVDVDIDLGFGVWLRGRRIRMNGIDTPEIHTRDETEKRFGLLSRDKLIEWISDRKLVLKVDTDDLDKFGRILGDLCDEVTGESACEYLINNYLAVKYSGQNKEKIYQEHIENRERLGKWE